MKFIARIPWKPTKYISEDARIVFTFQDILNPDPLFSIRELLIPWLKKGNIPLILMDETPR